MSQKYTQLSLVQRYQIQAFLKAGMKQKRIAQEIGVHASTVSRELSRNITQRGRTAGEYLAENAQRKTERRHELKPKQVKFTNRMKEQAVKWLTQEKWSPEIISVEGHKTGKCPVSREWLYQWIWKSKHSNTRGARPFITFKTTLRIWASVLRIRHFKAITLAGKRFKCLVKLLNWL